MILVKILKRKDAASVAVAVIVALIVSNFLSIVTQKPAARLAGLGDANGLYSSGGWQLTYLQPFLAVVFQLLALEILAWLYVGVSGAMRKR